MPEKKRKVVQDYVAQNKVAHEDIHLYTDKMCVQMPAGQHDPLIAAVALFNVKYVGETVRLWFSAGSVSKYKCILQWDLGNLAYRLLTHDAAGSKNFEYFDIESLMQLSEFKQPVAIVYCNTASWDEDGKAKIDQLTTQHPPANFRIKEEPEGDKAVRYTFVPCGATGRASKAAAAAVK